MESIKNLVIVESPSKSNTIQKYLGKDYKVVPSVGHIRDLSTRGKGGLGVDIDNNFKADYVISEGKSRTVAELKKFAKQADHVYLATDPDREGEAISWHLAQELKLPEEEKNRVTFHEITHDAVLEAFRNPRAIDMELVHSQETRRILDRIIGFKLSNLLRSKIKSKSAGRVQSAALKLIVDREREIEAFQVTEYWTIEAKFEKDGFAFDASLAKIDGEKAELKTEEEAAKIVEACGGPFVISAIKETSKSTKPFKPFITSTLQQEASTKLGFPAKKTMSVAQRLYEGIDVGRGEEGLITYMRTDSPRLSDVYVKAAHSYITKKYGKDYNGYFSAKAGSNAQDAHEAIRPTSIDNEPEKIKPYLTSDQYKLYKLIYARALVSQMAPRVTQSTSVTLSQNGYDFTANGSKETFDGWTRAYKDYYSSEEKLLPELKEQEQLNAKEVKPERHETTPPARYTEARLIHELEEQGIGRPSTYAMIIDTIRSRGYVQMKDPRARNSVFIPTDQGKLTVDKLTEFFSDSIMNIKYTAEMETELDEIASGDADEVATLKRFWDEFTPMLDEAYKNMEKVKPEPVGEKCPDCGEELVYRVGPYGKFISCSGYPKCRYHRNIASADKPAPEHTGRTCPKCGKGELLKRMSRRRTFFYGCDQFPRCDYMETLDGEEIIPKRKRAAAAKTAGTKTTAAKKPAAKKTTTRKTAAKKKAE